MEISVGMMVWVRTINEGRVRYIQGQVKRIHTKDNRRQSAYVTLVVRVHNGPAIMTVPASELVLSPSNPNDAPDDIIE